MAKEKLSSAARTGPTLDRSTSQRAPASAGPKISTSLERSLSSTASSAKHAAASGSDVAHRPAPPKPTRTPLSPAKAGDGATGAQPRRREPKNKGNDPDIVERLKAICTDADPTKLYRNLVKIGQGYVRLCGSARD